LARGDDLVADEIGFARRRRADMHGLVGQLHMRRVGVGVGIDGDGAHAHAAAPCDDAAGDFAAIGDEDLSKHEPWLSLPKILSFERGAPHHIRNTPNFVSSTGALSAGGEASASTRRVSAGRMMPSSQSRAVAW
jgi:hypothetical protein